MLFDSLEILFFGGVSYFVRIFCCLILLPLDFNQSGIVQRFLLSLVFSACFYQIIGPQETSLSTVLLDILIGFSCGFIIFFPIKIATMLGEMTDNLRGINIANFYDLNSHQNSNYLSLVFKIYILVLLFQLGLAERILLTLYSTYQKTNVGYEDQLSFYSSSILEYCNKILISGFEFLLPFALAFLFVQLLFLIISKFFSNQSFIGEIFLSKLLVFGIILFYCKEKILERIQL